MTESNLIYIINRNISEKNIPKNFKNAAVGLIFKRTDRTEVINYRPMFFLKNRQKLYTYNPRNYAD